MSLTKFSVVFPGQGSQYPGMLLDYIDKEPKVKSLFLESSDLLDLDLIHLLRKGSVQDLSKTEITQPLMLTANIALWCLVNEFLERPICVAGHSLGEYAALVAAKVLSFKDALSLVKERSKLMQSAVPDGKGGIAAVIGLTEEEVSRVCKKITKNLGEDHLVNIGNINSQNQIVISGTKEGIQLAIKECKISGAKKAIPLAMSVPAHSMLMKSAADILVEAINLVEFNIPVMPILHNIDADSETDPKRIKIKLIEQMYKPVRWLDTIKKISDKGASTIIECGPSKVLCGLIKRISREIRTIHLDSYDNYINLQNGKR